MTTLTLEEIEAAFERITSTPPPSGTVRDRRTGSLGTVSDDLGTSPDEHGRPTRRILVKVIEPKAWHQKGDPVIWREPIPCGQ